MSLWGIPPHTEASGGLHVVDEKEEANNQLFCVQGAV
jgi:hypothetical protein